jgi:hypothetical protein
MKRTLILTALIAAVAAPVYAQSARSVAFDVFNESVDSVSDIRRLPSGDDTVSVSTRGNSALATAFEVFNESAASVSDLRGLNGATVLSGTPAHGADIFADLRAESRESE